MSYLKPKFAAILLVLFTSGFLSLGAVAADAGDAAAMSTDTNMGVLLDNPKSKAILEKHIPGISQGTEMELAIARSMSLSELAPISDGRVTDDMLKAINADLGKLK